MKAMRRAAVERARGGVPLRRRPVRHRADPPRRASRSDRRRAPRARRGAPAGADVDLGACPARRSGASCACGSRSRAGAHRDPRPARRTRDAPVISSVTQVLRADAWCPPGSGGPSAPPLGPGWVAIEGDRIVDAGAGAAPARRDRSRRLGTRAGIRRPAVQRARRRRSLGRTRGRDRRARRPARGARRHRLLPDDDHPAARGIRPAGSIDSGSRGLAAAGDRPGAAVLGAHLEGPFLGDAPGAHPVSLIRPGGRRMDRGTCSPRTQVRWRSSRSRPKPTRSSSSPRCSSARRITVALGHSRCDVHRVHRGGGGRCDGRHAPVQRDGLGCTTASRASRAPRSPTTVSRRR